MTSNSYMDRCSGTCSNQHYEEGMPHCMFEDLYAEVSVNY